MRKFFGKYRGKITANQDPLHQGRIQVTVPAVFGEEQIAWALPCTPYAGHNIGFFTIPPIHTNVWVEFEAGDPNYPIWSGCFWANNQLPAAARVDEPDKVQVLKTDGITLVWSNLGNKGVSLVVENPVLDRKLKMILNADGIELNNADDTTVKIKADQIELKNKQNTTVTLTATDVSIKQTAVELKLTASDISLTCNPATLKLSTASGIEISNAPASAKLSATGIELSSAAAGFKVTPAQIELSNVAANIKLSPVSVSINNGALEVI